MNTLVKPHLFHPLELQKGGGNLIPRLLKAMQSSSKMICMAARGYVTLPGHMASYG